ncbi:MAG TPA: type II secretion system protein GspJ [Candidatus Hydrogenedentes bacterium]|nr:type II secretion system protein GspJ [Candidatus Hydrogenedentota bacterium]
MKRLSRDMPSSGFTLLELLLGTVISAVLLAALYGVYHGALRSQSRAYAVLEEAAPRGYAVDIIRRDLQNMAPPGGLLSGHLLGQPQNEATYRRDALEFCATTGRLSEAAPWGEIQRIAYALEKIDDRSDAFRLVRTVTRNLLPAALEDSGEPTALLEGVNSFEVQYFDGLAWIDSWDSTAMDNALPLAVRVRIGFEPIRATGAVPRPIEIACEALAQRPAPSAGSGS